MVQNITLFVQVNGPGNWAVLHRVGPDPVPDVETIEQAIKAQYEAGYLPSGDQGYLATGDQGYLASATVKDATTYDRDASGQPRTIDTLEITTVYAWQP